MRTVESPTRPLSVESQQLVTQSEALDDEILASTKDATKPAEEVPEPHDHGKNLIRRCQNEPMANSLILQAYDLLMNVTPTADESGEISDFIAN